jgi:hypothetical protein
MILPKNSLLQQSYYSHESQSVWRNMQRVKRLKKTIGMSPLEGNCGAVCLNTEESGTNLEHVVIEQTVKVSHILVTQKRKTATDHALTHWINNDLRLTTQVGSFFAASTALDFFPLSRRISFARSNATLLVVSLNDCKYPDKTPVSNDFPDFVLYLWTTSFVNLCLQVHFVVSLPVRLLV